MTPDPARAIHPRFQPPESFVDPRTQDDFEAHHWPLCNDGEPPPIGATDLHERRCLEFLAAYYEYNRRFSRVLAARDAGASSKKVAGYLAATQAAADDLDALLDRYAAVGFEGEPTMRGDFYHHIAFQPAELPKLPAEAALFSSHLAIPGLEEIPEVELQGPLVVSRFSHGKVDS